MGLRASDRWAIPLTRREHSDCHLVPSKDEIDYFYQRGIDCIALANELWEATGDLKRMTEIVRKHYEKDHELARCKERKD